MKTSQKGLMALIVSEGVVLESYKDGVGVWTIGIGHTASAGAPKPRPKLKITMQKALDIFNIDIQRYEADVNSAIKIKLKQHEFDALVSFHYNTGGIRRAKLTKSLNAENRTLAAEQFMGWLKPISIKSRRVKEQKLFKTGNYGNYLSAMVYGRVNNNSKPRDGIVISLANVFPKVGVRHMPTLRQITPVRPEEVITIASFIGAIWASILAFFKIRKK